jgi:O-antigen/teichoic acid export membrane protein
MFPSMKVIIPYLVALAMLGLGAFLMKHTSRYSRTGGEEFERRMKRRVIAIVLLIAGVMFLGLAVLNQIVPQVSPDASSGTATRAP